MNASTVFQEIENLKEKKILSFLKKCQKKLSIKSSSDLSNLSSLAYWLYIYDHPDFALKVCELIDPIEFTNDFDVWTPIEEMLLLKSRIYRETKQNELAGKTIFKIEQPMKPHGDAMNRRLSWEWLSDKSIEQCLARGDSKGANTYRFSDLPSLFFIRELGEGKFDLDGKPVPVRQAEDRIAVYLDLLKHVK